MMTDPTIDLHGKTCVKCADCQTLYEAIGAQCPKCGSTEVL